MPIDAEIPLQVKTQPLVDPLQSIAHLMQMRGQTAELALRQAQADEQRSLAREHQMKVEQDQRDLADQNTVQSRLQTDPEFAHAIGKGDVSVLNGITSPQFQVKYGEALNKAIKEHSLASEEDLKLGDHRSKIAAETLQGFAAMEDDATRAAAWPGTIARLKSQGILEGIDVPPAISGSMKEINALAARNALFQGINKAALDLRKESQPLDIAAQAENRAATTFATEQPVKAAVAQATLADEGLLTPEQRAVEGGRQATEQHAMDQFALDQKRFVESQRHNRAEEGLAAARLNKEKDDDKILSPVEAATLGVAYGTTKKQAATMNLQPSTAAQNTVAAYAARIRNASDELDRLDVNVYERNAPNFMNTAKGQQFDQAQRDFINAVLRRESGAVINSGEFDNAYKQYIPKTGDSPEVLQQKKNNRELQFAAFKRAAGNAYQDPAETIRKANTGGMVRARDPQGVLHEAPAGTPLPPGWKAEP